MVKITDPAKYAGKQITITYNATVNDEAETVEGQDYHAVTNKLVGNDGTPIPGTETLTKIFGFKFTKVNAQGEAVEGAKFTLSVAKDRTACCRTAISTRSKSRPVPTASSSSTA